MAKGPDNGNFTPYEPNYGTPYDMGFTPEMASIPDYGLQSMSNWLNPTPLIWQYIQTLTPEQQSIILGTSEGGTAAGREHSYPNMRDLGTDLEDPRMPTTLPSWTEALPSHVQNIMNEIAQRNAPSAVGGNYGNTGGRYGFGPTTSGDASDVGGYTDPGGGFSGWS